MAGFPEAFSVFSTQLAYAFSGFLSSSPPVLLAVLAPTNSECAPYKVEGKTRTVYVPLDLLDDVRAWIDNHKRHKALLAEVHQLAVALIKTHVQTRKRKAGRP